MEKKAPVASVKGGKKNNGNRKPKTVAEWEV